MDRLPMTPCWSSYWWQDALTCSWCHQTYWIPIKWIWYQNDMKWSKLMRHIFPLLQSPIDKVSSSTALAIRITWTTRGHSWPFVAPIACPQRVYAEAPPKKRNGDHSATSYLERPKDLRFVHAARLILSKQDHVWKQYTKACAVPAEWAVPIGSAY